MSVNDASASHPLWRLLVSASNPEDDAALTCEECFAVLEYYADEVADGANPDKLRRMARRHLEHCPDCRERFTEWLQEAEREAQHHS